MSRSTSGCTHLRLGIHTAWRRQGIATKPPRSSTSTSEETQQVAAWPRSGDTRCAGRRTERITRNEKEDLYGPNFSPFISLPLLRDLPFDRCRSILGPRIKQCNCATDLKY